MRAFVGITDWDWFELLRRQPGLDEVNFWQPSGSRQCRALKPGELFLFKLHSPRNYIVGGGIFAHWSPLPISLAWEAFGIANGAVDFAQMRARVERYRHQGHEQFADYTIGCILLEQPFFLNENQWIPVPDNWSLNIVQGRGYDLTVEPGLTLWTQLQTAIGTPLEVREEVARYGPPPRFVALLLEGGDHAVELRDVSGRLEQSGYHLRLTRDLDHAKKYLMDRYSEADYLGGVGFRMLEE